MLVISSQVGESTSVESSLEKKFLENVPLKMLLSQSSSLFFCSESNGSLEEGSAVLFHLLSVDFLASLRDKVFL